MPEPEPTAWTPPQFYVHQAQDGVVTLVDRDGNSLDCPPSVSRIINGDEKFVDPWGNEIPAYKVPEKGFFVHTAADGTRTAVDVSGAPLPVQPDLGFYDGDKLAPGPWDNYPAYEYPEEIYLHTAADGTRTAVDASGVPLPSQPDLGWYDGTTLAPGPWDNYPAYEFPDGIYLHTAADGTRTAVDASGAPLPVQPDLGYYDGTTLVPGPWDNYPAYKYPDGIYVHTAPDGTRTAVNEGGTPLPSQPDLGWYDGTTLVPGPWDNYPAYEFPKESFFVHTATDGTRTAVDASGAPLPVQPDLGYYDGIVLAPGPWDSYPPYQLPKTYFVHTAADGTMTAVDANGTPLPTQPQLAHEPEDGTVSVKGSDGSVYYPPPIYPPPGDQPEEWPPPGYGESEPPPAEESGEAETGEVVDETDPEARGRAEPVEAVPGDPAASAEEEKTSEGRSAEPEVEAEPAASEVGEVLTLETEEEPAAGREVGEEPAATSEGRAAEVEADRVRLVEEEGEGAPSRMGEVAAPEMVEPVEMGAVEAVGPVGLGAEELVEMVSGPVAEEGEVAAREPGGPPAGGEQVVEIPDLLAPELDRKGDDRPVPGPGDVEFRVEVAPAEELVDAEPMGEVVEVDSVTGLGSGELGGVLAGSDAPIAAEEAGEGIVERVEAEGSGLGEEVPELKWGTEVGAGVVASLAGEAVLPELEGKVVPDVEPEVVDFKVEVVPVEEVGTLEIDDEVAGGLARAVEEPEDEPVGRYLTEEEPEEEGEIQS